MSARALVIGAVSVTALVVTVAVAVNHGFSPLGASEGCTAEVNGHKVEIGLEQAENAALIAAIGVRRSFPARAVSIALATAYQESKLINIEYGDRDSIGLFQQRPSQGWGTREEILNPYYATNAFYDALAKIDGYQDMRITEAAQKVQRSGFPEAYEKHAADARALASALTGNSTNGQFTCAIKGDAAQGPSDLSPQGLVERAETVLADLEAAFGERKVGGFSPEGVNSGHMSGSAHYDGRAVDVFFRPIGKAQRKQGWATAYYLVAQADRLQIATVIFDDMIWTAGRSEDGWREYDPGDVSGKPAGTVAILEHRDHVHVDVHK